MDGQEGSIGTDLTDLSGDDLKLLLKRGGLGSHFKFLHDLSEGRALTDHDGHHLTLTGGDRGSREQDWGWELVGLSLVNFLVVNVTLLASTLNASVEGLLSALIRLTSHGSFVGGELVTREEDTIDGDQHTVTEVNDVTDVEEIDMDGEFSGIAIFARAGNSNLISNYPG